MSDYPVDRFGRLSVATWCAQRCPRIIVQCGEPGVPVGWNKLLDRCLLRLAAVLNDYSEATIRLEDIKGKNGGIAIYWSSTGLSSEAQDRVWEIIDLAEAASATTNADGSRRLGAKAYFFGREDAHGESHVWTYDVEGDRLVCDDGRVIDVPVPAAAGLVL